MSSTHRVLCLVLPGYSALACAAATAPLTAFNRLSGEQAYRVQYIGLDKHVESDTGQTLAVDDVVSEGSTDKCSCDLLVVCGGSPAYYAEDERAIAPVQHLYRRARWRIAIGTGSYLFAVAGLLNGKKASIHWWNAEEISQRFPAVYDSMDLYSIDHHIGTCRAGTAALDLMVAILGKIHGPDLVNALSEYFVRERLGRQSSTPVEQKLTPEILNDNPKLTDAIALMKQHLESPLSTDEIASRINLSLRQLERLFKKHLKDVPSHIYLTIRLTHARHALLTHSDSITDIALSFGFSSSAHFSTRYRHQFGLTPTEDRVRHHDIGSPKS